MIRVCVKDNAVCLSTGEGKLAPEHESQLAFWGFVSDSGPGCYQCRRSVSAGEVQKLVRYLKHAKLPYELSQEIAAALESQERNTEALRQAKLRGQSFKNGRADRSLTKPFLDFLHRNLRRPLKQHQVKAALHFLHAVNTANFSVPGSGKTATILAAFAFLRQSEEVQSLFVVGPPACFAPWRREYEDVLGVPPSCQTLAGGDIDRRRWQYLTSASSVADLYLITFQTLQRDVGHVRILFEQQGIRFFLVVDEAHYIKQADGIWASAALEIAPHAARRCILTGTPFPRQYADAYNLFDFLWPGSSPIGADERTHIQRCWEQKHLQEASKVLDRAIAPLFYRVRKRDLGLAPQVYHKPMQVIMNPVERRVYEAIIGRIRALAGLDDPHSTDILLRLRRGRMVRLRQCLSSVSLLASALDDYPEDLTAGESPISEIIRDYAMTEVPAKLTTLISLVRQLRQAHERVVVWSNFVGTLKAIHESLSRDGHGVGLIYGATPIYSRSLEDEESREAIIEQFCDRKSCVDVLVANPAACAESISLHKTCHHAIYYDLSYNCAQYLQSLDRIHRVGGSERAESHYYVLQYAGTIDADIHTNLRQKADRMGAIIDREYPIYASDMFADDEELEAYERLFLRP